MNIHLTRARGVRVLAVVLPLAVVAAAAGSFATRSDGSPLTSAGAQRASAAGELTVGWAEPPDTLNPATTGARDVGPILVNVFDTLVWLTKDLKITPDLATKWAISKDGKTYTFTLRQGVKFHDGTPFDAQSVVDNINYITDKTTQSTISIGLLGPCTKAKATAKYTLVVSCTKPYAPLLAQLGEPYFGIQSPTAIKKYGKNVNVHPVGTGPFQFVSYTPNQSVVLERNPNYKWAPPAVGKNGPASISKITYHIVVSSQARVSELQSGQSQMIQETPGVFYKSLGKSGQFTATAVPIEGMGIWAPINADRWPTNDVNVRKAILYAVDKKGAIQVADNGVFPPLNTPLTKEILGYNPALESMYPYSPDKVTSILTKDGWTKSGGFWTKGGKRLTLQLTAISSVPEYPLIAQAIQGYLRKAGMDATIRQEAVPAWLASNIKGSMSLTPLQYVAVDPDALHLWYLPGQYYNWSHYSNPTLTKLIQQGQVEQDRAKRAQIYQKAQKFIMDQALSMPIHENQDLVLTSKKLTGMTWSGGGFEYFYTASLSS